MKIVIIFLVLSCFSIATAKIRVVSGNAQVEGVGSYFENRGPSSFKISGLGAFGQSNTEFGQFWSSDPIKANGLGAQFELEFGNNKHKFYLQRYFFQSNNTDYNNILDDSYQHQTELNYFWLGYRNTFFRSRSTESDIDFNIFFDIGSYQFLNNKITEKNSSIVPAANAQSINISHNLKTETFVGLGLELFLKAYPKHKLQFFTATYHGFIAWNLQHTDKVSFIVRFNNFAIDNFNNFGYFNNHQGYRYSYNHAYFTGGISYEF